jgi:hypothetical protein
MEDIIDYSPLTESEFKDLEGKLNNVGHYLPDEYLSQFWSWCNTIRGDRQPQPCSCKSSAKHWGNCVEVLRNFVNGKKG